METIYQDGQLYKLVRLTCNCGSPAHSLDFEIEHDEVDGWTIGLTLNEKYSGHRMSLLMRVKNAVNILRGQEICFYNFIVREQDYEPMIALLQEAKAKFVNGKEGASE